MIAASGGRGDSVVEDFSSPIVFLYEGDFFFPGTVERFDPQSAA